MAIGQKDIKGLIAFTSISHFGFITMGIFAMTSQGMSGANLYMVNHGFSTAALFLVAGWMMARRKSSTILILVDCKSYTSNGMELLYCWYVRFGFARFIKLC